MAYETEYQQIVDALSEARNKIARIENRELKNLTDRIVGDLTAHTNFLNVQLGNDVVGEPQSTKTVAGGGGLKRMLGRDITVAPQNQGAAPVLDNDKLSYSEYQARQKQIAQDAELAAFKLKLDELYPVFRSIENATLLDQYDEVVLRGIAKYAGLPVSDFSPKEIDDAFITKIKDAMNVKDQQAASGTANDQFLPL